METNNQSTTTEQEDLLSQPRSTKKKLYNTPWFIIGASIAGLLLLVLPVAMLLFGSGASGGAADKFYAMIETTAQKTKIRYGYTLAVPKVGEQFSVDVKSLAEYDAVAGEYSTAYASEAITASAARCVKGKEYESASDNKYPDDFKQAEEILRGPFQVNDDKFTVGACEFSKLRYQGDFTDGMLAVGLTPEQAKNMTDDLRMNNPAKLSDGGKVTYKGKAARKISFEVGKSLTGTSYQSDAFFYSFRDGTSSQVGANVPLDELEKHFDSVFQVPAVGLKGYYLIDEATNLPLYRYLETVADGGQSTDFAARTIMSEYSFPDALTMDENTQLPEITKQ